MAPDTLIDSRHCGWFWLEDEVIDCYGRLIGAIGVAIYTYLARRADSQGVCFPSYQTIADDLHLSRRTVISYIQRLQAHGLIVIRRHKGPGRAANVYRLVSLRQKSPQETPPEPPPTPPAPPTPPPAATGAADAPVSELHSTGAADAPVLVQEIHPTGAAVAPQGNPKKETQEKETQQKDESAPEKAALAAMIQALCTVTGKEFELLSPRKQQALQAAGSKLLAHNYSAEDVLDFSGYWQQAHYIGSRPHAGRPHLTQVLEDMPAARAWVQNERQRQAEEAAWQEEETLSTPAPEPVVDAAALALWQELALQLRLRLWGHPALADVNAARPIALQEDILTVQLPYADRVMRWQRRLQRPLQQALATLSTPCQVQFVAPAI